MVKPLVSLLMVACVAAACSSGPLPDVVHAAFDCSGPIDRLTDPPESYIAVLDVVALPDIEIHQQGRQEADAESGVTRRFSKMGLLIRSETEFTVSVAAESRGNTMISWSNTGRPGLVEGLAVSGCPGDDPWLVYPGGVWVIEPACVTLTVMADGESADVTLPIGQRCA